jgi:hypothetical protein
MKNFLSAIRNKPKVDILCDTNLTLGAFNIYVEGKKFVTTAFETQKIMTTPNFALSDTREKYQVILGTVTALSLS